MGILCSHHGSKWGRVVAAAIDVLDSGPGKAGDGCGCRVIHGDGRIVHGVGPGNVTTRSRPVGRVWEISTGRGKTIGTKAGAKAQE